MKSDSDIYIDIDIAIICLLRYYYNITDIDKLIQFTLDVSIAWIYHVIIKV